MTGTDQDRPDSSGGGEPMTAARAATGSGPVPVLGIVLALLLLALAVVLVRDALVVLGAVAGSPWLTSAAAAVPVVAPSALVIVVGVVLALLGLWLVSQALRRRTRKAIAIRSRTGMFTEAVDVARLSSGAARGVDGVLDVRSTAQRRKVDVRVTTTGDASTVDAVRSAVTDRLSELDPTPRVRVRADSQGASS